MRSEYSSPVFALTLLLAATSNPVVTSYLCQPHRQHVHIACTQLTLPVVETFISDLKASVAEAKDSPEDKGTMVALYGRFLLFARVNPYT